MLSKEYVGSVCEVKTLKNVFITAGRIEELTEDGLVITDPSGPMPILPYKTPVKIAIFNSNAGFRMMAGQVFSSAREALRIMDVLDFLEYERRRFFRLDIDASAYLMVQRGPDGKLLATPKKLPVRVRNLSLCGAMFMTDEVFNLRDQMTLHMPLYKNQEEDLSIVVLRIEETEEGETAYGVEIIDLDKRVEQNLCAYLFEQQRQQIRRQKVIAEGR